MQKSIKFQIEEDKIIEADVTHWLELEEQAQVQQGQEQDTQNHNLPDQSESVEEDQTIVTGLIFRSQWTGSE
jgi:hypothetical protein